MDPRCSIKSWKTFFLPITKNISCQQRPVPVGSNPTLYNYSFSVGVCPGGVFAGKSGWGQEAEWRGQVHPKVEGRFRAKVVQGHVQLDAEASLDHNVLGFDHALVHGHVAAAPVEVLATCSCKQIKSFVMKS